MNIGRVFLRDDPFCPRVAIALSLESHTGNVVQLAQLWSTKKAYRTPLDLSQTHHWLVEAARRHDAGKSSTFRLNYSAKDGITYSFRGHRFRVSCDNLYVQGLVRLHHEYSVDAVVEWQAELRRHAQYKPYADHFPLDLYTLEMCDQIAAEAESYAFGSVPDERFFMDLHSRPRDDGWIEVEPFPFDCSRIQLTLRYGELAIDGELRGRLCRLSRQATGGRDSELATRLCDKLRDALTSLPDSNLKEVRVRLCCPMI